MKSIQLKKPGGFKNLKVTEMDVNEPGVGEIKVELKASSLNYHDLMVVGGMIPTEDGRIPMSDGAGNVVAVGPDVSDFSVGDKVISTFAPNYISGEPGRHTASNIPGDSADGYAREFVCAPETSFTKAPDGYTHEEAATITCAGVTAWRGLFVAGKVKAGDSVLVQGTGGVSMYALQLAKMAGATVIATSSSDEKLEKLKALGADHLINYKEDKQWGRAVTKLTDGRGVDHVIDVGGPANMPQSFAAVRIGGHIAYIGGLTGIAGNVPLVLLIAKQFRITGIAVGSRTDQQDLVRALSASNLRPVIDSTFPLEEIGDAFKHQQSQKHFGKICLDIGS